MEKQGAKSLSTIHSFFLPYAASRRKFSPFFRVRIM
jgi:hypothetical protein